MIRYEDAIHTCVRWAQNQRWFGAARTVVLVRDTMGRVRLAVDGAVDIEADAAMHDELGGWSGGIISSEGPQDERAIVQRILEWAEPWPTRWPNAINDGFGGTERLADSWRMLERTPGKQSWLDSADIVEPWPLHDKTPSIATFYSFKGGVGRTTALLLTAALRARSGSRVLCIDLDLEAPGVADAVGIAPTHGMLDLLLHHHVHGRLDATEVRGAIQSCEVEPGASFDVLPASLVDSSYVERVARLDYLGSAATPTASPVAAALCAILKLVKPDYDVILIDARAGVHDLGGLAMLDMSHATVIVFRPDQQALAGLDIVLPTFARRRPPQARRLVIALSFAPIDDEQRVVKLQRWREQVFRRCDMAGSVYEGTEEPPGLPDNDVPHDLVPLVESPFLSHGESLLGHDSPPSGTPGYAELERRLAAVLEPEATDMGGGAR